MKNVIVLAFVIFGLSGASLAQKPAVVTSDEAGWQKIGETTASFKKQDESIHVFGADKFSAIKLKVLDAPLSIERFQVFYESGKMEDIDVRDKIERDGESSVINLQYPDEDISKVAFTYQSAPNYHGNKANVVLYGMKKDEGQSSYRHKEETINEQGGENTREDVERAAERTRDDIDSASEESGDRISEIAAKGAAEIIDERHETKVGPNGQTIYIGNDKMYYYINNEGRKVYVSETQLKDKKDN